MIIYWKRMIWALVLSNALSLLTLYSVGVLAGFVVATVGGLLIGFASQIPWEKFIK